MDRDVWKGFKSEFTIENNCLQVSDPRAVWISQGEIRNVSSTFKKPVSDSSLYERLSNSMIEIIRTWGVDMFFFSRDGAIRNSWLILELFSFRQFVWDSFQSSNHFSEDYFEHIDTDLTYRIRNLMALIPKTELNSWKSSLVIEIDSLLNGTSTIQKFSHVSDNVKNLVAIFFNESLTASINEGRVLGDILSKIFESVDMSSEDGTLWIDILETIIYSGIVYR